MDFVEEELLRLTDEGKQKLIDEGLLPANTEPHNEDSSRNDREGDEPRSESTGPLSYEQ